MAARAACLGLLLALSTAAWAQSASRSGFLAVQRQVEALYPHLVESTVIVRMRGRSGSGVIVSPDGWVLTAGHVVGGTRGARCSVGMADGRRLEGAVVDSSRDHDIGIIKLEGAKDLPSVPIGDSGTLRRGEWVLATGHPLGEHRDRPPVLRVGRVLRLMEGRGEGEYRGIMTDAPIISGDSGGPLIDLTGRLVAIHSMITQGGRRMASIHVPVNPARLPLRRARMGEEPGSWDARPAGLTRALREADVALDGGDAAAALRLAGEATRLDPDGAAARVLLARAAARAGNANLAISAIEAACERGYNDAEALRTDRDLAPLCRRAPLAPVVARLESYTALPGQRKSDSALLAAASSAASERDGGTVRVTAGGRQVALGTVMSAAGDVLTKASELPEGAIECVLANGRSVPAERVAADTGWDLALLRIRAPGLRPLRLTDHAGVGAWTLTPNARGDVEAIGVVGVGEMPVRGRGIAPRPTSKAFLGVRVEPLDPELGLSMGLKQGVRLTVQPDFPAERAGIRTGDVALEADGKPIANPDAFMDLLVAKHPGDSLRVHLARGSERLDVTVKLTTRPADLPGRGGLPVLLSGEVSQMQGPFPRVLQHDAMLPPEAMGGPLLDLDGRCIGLNIARADRTSTYAIEAADLRELYAKLKSGS